MIDAVRFIPVMRMLVDSSGLPLPPGLRVRALPSGETTLTGFDGLVEVNAGAADTRLMVGSPGSGCVVNLTGLDLTGAGDAPLRCERAVIAADGDEPRGARKRAAANESRGATLSPPAGAVVEGSCCIWLRCRWIVRPVTDARAPVRRSFLVTAQARPALGHGDQQRNRGSIG